MAYSILLGCGSFNIDHSRAFAQRRRRLNRETRKGNLLNYGILLDYSSLLGYVQYPIGLSRLLSYNTILDYSSPMDHFSFDVDPS